MSADLMNKQITPNQIDVTPYFINKIKTKRLTQGISCSLSIAVFELGKRLR